MGRVVIPGFRKIETSGGEGGTTNYEDLTNKPSINNVPLVGNLNTVDLKLTDKTLTEEGVPAEAKTVGAKLEEHSTSLTELSEQLGSHTVKSDVPENAVFTDTVYDDTEVQKRISDNGYGEVAGGKNLATVSSFSTQNNEIIFTKKDDSTLIANGSNYTGGVGISKIFLAKEGITYTAQIITDLQLNMFIWNSDENILVAPPTSSKEISFSVAKDTHISIAIDTNNVVFNNTEIKVQIEEGSVATSYEPYFPSNKMLTEEVSAQNESLYGYYIELDKLGVLVPFSIKSGESFTVSTQDGSNFTPAKIGFYDENETEIENWDLAGYGSNKRTITYNYNLATAYYVSIYGRSAQKCRIVKSNNDLSRQLSNTQYAVGNIKNDLNNTTICSYTGNGATVSTTDWEYHGTNITIPKGYYALVVAERKWSSGKPSGVAISLSDMENTEHSMCTQTEGVQSVFSTSFIVTANDNPVNVYLWSKGAVGKSEEVMFATLNKIA